MEITVVLEQTVVMWQDFGCPADLVVQELMVLAAVAVAAAEDPVAKVIVDAETLLEGVVLTMDPVLVAVVAAVAAREDYLVREEMVGDPLMGSISLAMAQMDD